MRTTKQQVERSPLSGPGGVIRVLETHTAETHTAHPVFRAVLCYNPRPMAGSNPPRGALTRAPNPSDWGRSSVGRAPEWHSGGRRFDPVRLHQSNQTVTRPFGRVLFAVSIPRPRARPRKSITHAARLSRARVGSSTGPAAPGASDSRAPCSAVRGPFL
jgi:hypothetical protein